MSTYRTQVEYVKSPVVTIGMYTDQDIADMVEYALHAYLPLSFQGQLSERGLMQYNPNNYNGIPDDRKEKYLRTYLKLNYNFFRLEKNFVNHLMDDNKSTVFAIKYTKHENFDSVFGGFITELNSISTQLGTEFLISSTLAVYPDNFWRFFFPALVESIYVNTDSGEGSTARSHSSYFRKYQISDIPNNSNIFWTTNNEGFSDWWNNYGYTSMGGNDHPFFAFHQVSKFIQNTHPEYTRCFSSFPVELYFPIPFYLLLGWFWDNGLISEFSSLYNISLTANYSIFRNIIVSTLKNTGVDISIISDEQELESFDLRNIENPFVSNPSLSSLKSMWNTLAESESCLVDMGPNYIPDSLSVPFM